MKFEREDCFEKEHHFMEDEDRCCRDDDRCEKRRKRMEEKEVQEHVHEFEGSTKLAELEDDPHNHRFAGVSGEEIEVPGGHIHKIFTRTDFFQNHFHFVIRLTGLQIPVGNGKHVHFVMGMTTMQDGHRHQFQFATLIDDPLSPTPKEDY